MRALKWSALLMALALFTGGCGEWTPPMPTAPSNSADGATIVGTVVGTSNNAALLPLTTAASTGAGSTVTIVGTDITATISGSGKFVLKLVPSGNVELEFSGGGLSGKIRIRDVGAEHIAITVTVDGSTVHLDGINRIQPEDNAVVEGVIGAISHGDRSMKVNGLEIKIWDAPVLNGSSRVGISTLQVGDRVRVIGTVQHDYIVATEVRVGSASGPTPPNPNPPSPPPSDPSPGPGSETIEGVISSISYGDRSMKVNGLEIKVRDAPVYKGGSRVGLTLMKVGDRVRVTGVWEHDYLIATRVDIL
jgi:hypothetical protein